MPLSLPLVLCAALELRYHGSRVYIYTRERVIEFARARNLKNARELIVDEVVEWKVWGSGRVDFSFGGGG